MHCFPNFASQNNLYVVLFTAIPIRLQGPSKANGTGRVEVYYNGQWGTICDDSWGINAANVACRQLGYLYAVRALPSYLVPDGSGQIWLDDVYCTGREQNLSSCNHNGWGTHDCQHYNDAGVECSSTGKNLSHAMLSRPQNPPFLGGKITVFVDYLLSKQKR